MDQILEKIWNFQGMAEIRKVELSFDSICLIFMVKILWLKNWFLGGIFIINPIKILFNRN